MSDIAARDNTQRGKVKWLYRFMVWDLQIFSTTALSIRDTSARDEMALTRKQKS